MGWGLGGVSWQAGLLLLQGPARLQRPLPLRDQGVVSQARAWARLGRAGKASWAQAVPRRRRGEKTLFLFPQVPPPPSLRQ